MITEKLILDIIAFCNTFINVKNVGWRCSYIGNTNTIIFDFKIWSLDENGFMYETISNCQKYINNENDFIEIKNDIIKNYKKELEIANK